MSTFWLIVVGLGSFIAGRVYARMKYHYPEHVEAMAVKVAKLRAERAKAEADTEHWRSQTDDSLDRRTAGGKR